MRLTVVSGRPVQYHAPLFRRLHEDGGLEMEVLYASAAGARPTYDPGFGREIRWDRDLLAGYPCRVFEKERVLGGTRCDYASLFRAISSGRPDVVWVLAYAHLHSWIAMAAAVRAGSALLFRGQADLKPGRPLAVRAAKRVVLPRLFTVFDAILYSYEANRRYFRHYGVPPEKLFFCPSAVDGAWLREQTEGVNLEAFARDTLGVDPGKALVLFLGKLIPRKRPLDLLRAFARIPSSEEAVLVFVGSGELEARIRETAKEEGVGDRVRITGFLPQREVALSCAAADLVALPSELDPSPKALHEAMEFGVPAVIADAVGTAGDLIRDGENGCVHPVGDVGALSRCLEELLASPERRHRLGAAARETAGRWSIERTAEGVREAARHAASVSDAGSRQGG